MIKNDQIRTDKLLVELERNSMLQRQADVLRPLNRSVIVLTLIALAIMIIPPVSQPLNFAIVVPTLAVSVLVYVLEKHHRAGSAALLFCLWLNFPLLFFFVTNLLADGQANGAVFSQLLALIIILSGVLLGVEYVFCFAIGNATAILATYIYYYMVAQPPPLGSSWYSATLRAVFPVFAFFTLISVISWLYQRSLTRSADAMRAARQQITNDALLRRDLTIARDLQQRLFPPPLLHNHAFDIASRSEAAQETSGDFHDFIELDGHRLGIVVADVTGKGLAAALVMAMARSALRSEARRFADPADVLNYANQTLCQDYSIKQMITAFYGVLDLRTLTMRFSSAGHPYPVVRRRDRTVEELEVNGMPLAARPDLCYHTREIQLYPGDQVVLFSDGLIEERNGQHEMYGYERLWPTLDSASQQSPQQAIDDVWRRITAFRGPAVQSDDITLVVVQARRNTSGEGSTEFSVG